MWRPWAKSSNPQIHDTPAKTSTFSCSSFKDIQILCPDEKLQQPTTTAPTKRVPTIHHRVRIASAILRNWPHRQPDAPPSKPQPPEISLPGAEKRIVVYCTSLRVVRSTFLECKDVLAILQGIRVSVDERDLSMDSSFLRELQGILGGKDRLTLPQVFIGGRYMGGADEIRQLHEAGELRKIVEGFPAAEPGVCRTCGGYKFILCAECSGSHKLYSSKRGTDGFRICTACNENGLTRCPSCSCPYDGFSR